MLKQPIYIYCTCCALFFLFSCSNATHCYVYCYSPFCPVLSCSYFKLVGLVAIVNVVVASAGGGCWLVGGRWLRLSGMWMLLSLLVVAVLVVVVIIVVLLNVLVDLLLLVAVRCRCRQVVVVFVVAIVVVVVWSWWLWRSRGLMVTGGCHDCRRMSPSYGSYVVVVAPCFGFTGLYSGLYGSLCKLSSIAGK